MLKTFKFASLGNIYWKFVARVSFGWKQFWAIFVYPWVLEWVYLRPIYLLGGTQETTPWYYFVVRFNVPIPPAIRHDTWLTLFAIGQFLMWYGWVGLPNNSFNGPDGLVNVLRWRLFFMGLFVSIVTVIFPAYWAW